MNTSNQKPEVATGTQVGGKEQLVAGAGPMDDCPVCGEGYCFGHTPEEVAKIDAARAAPQCSRQRHS